MSKLFWIPDIEDHPRGYKGYEIKASPWAQVKTHLLTAVDENGLPFQIMANEDKEGEVRILQVLNNKFRGSVVCLEGGVRQPFLTDGPMGFRFYGISGADFKQDPQVWVDGMTLSEFNEKQARGLIGLHDLKRNLRREKAVA